MRKLLFSAFILGIACLVSGFALAVTDSGAEILPTGSNQSGADSTGEGELTTLFVSNNNYAGNSFDIEATCDLTIVGFDVNLDTSVPWWTVNVWIREGTASGFEQNPAGWTLLGTDTVQGEGVDNPTHINVGGLEITAGEVVGTIIQAEEAVSGVGGFCYTNGSSTVYSNTDMSITTYCGLSAEWPPEDIFPERMWNGTVYYDYGTSIAGKTWGCIKAEF